MPLIRYESGPFSGPNSLEFLGHDTVEAYDAQAGYPGACLDYALRWHIPRDTINRFDELFAPKLEELSGIPRKIDEARTAKRRLASPNPNRISPIKEKFVTYAFRVMEQVSPDVAEQIYLEALRLSRSLQICVAPAARTSPIEPMFYKRADSILETDRATQDSKISKFQSLCPNFELARKDDGTPERDSLARLLQQYESTMYALED